MKPKILNLWQENETMSQANYNAANEITYNTEVLKSILCDCNYAYILVKGDITVTTAPQEQVPF